MSTTPTKGKKSLFRVIFSRTTLFAALLVIQLSVLLLCYRLLERHFIWVYGIFTAFSALLVIYIINKPGNPAFKISWIVPIIVFPVFGALFYLFIKLQIGVRVMDRKLKSIVRRTSPYLSQQQTVLDEIYEQNSHVVNLASYVKRYGGHPIYRNTAALHFPSGESKFAELKRQLEQAERFIFLEYFIIAPGIMWNSVLDILKRKVEQGVEVRVMYDGTNTLGNLPWHYPETLRAMGIQCQVFSPLRPALSSVQNNRDHRKIVVIDGRVAFTGGINLADEYINEKLRFGHWKDSAIMIEGEAVRSFTLMFLQLWGLSSAQSEDYVEYLTSKPVLRPNLGYVMPYADSPLDDELVCETVYLDMIQSAQHYVHIITPYLIIDHEMTQSLAYAAKRGVDVKIIMPSIPDKWYALAVGKTYYPELIRAGVQIYEYTPGFCHAKIMVTDDEEAVVGTINLDFRSLYLHFECGVYLYRSPAVAQVEEDFGQTLEKCRLITLEDCRNFSAFTRIAGKVLRLLAPLM